MLASACAFPVGEGSRRLGSERRAIYRRIRCLSERGGGFLFHLKWHLKKAFGIKVAKPPYLGVLIRCYCVLEEPVRKSTSFVRVQPMMIQVKKGYKNQPDGPTHSFNMSLQRVAVM